MNKINIGNSKQYYLLAYENALLYYVYGRVTFNTSQFIHLLPSILYFFHHSLEISIKTLLKLKGISYPTSGTEGHQIYNLLLLDPKNERISNILKEPDIEQLLKSMDKSYTNNKYEYPGYYINGINFVEIIDGIIFSFYEEINTLLESKTPKHRLMTVPVPKCVEKLFLHNLKKTFGYIVVGPRE